MNLQEKIEIIADHYCLNIQSLKLAEECAEYAAAIQKGQIYCQLADNSGEKAFCYFNDLADKAGASCRKELADVLVLSRQIEYLMNDEPEFKEEIERLMNEKANRQLTRIEAEPK